MLYSKYVDVSVLLKPKKYLNIQFTCKNENFPILLDNGMFRAEDMFKTIARHKSTFSCVRTKQKNTCLKSTMQTLEKSSEMCQN